MLSKDIFIFLKALTVHNNREWFKKHITTFRTAESNVKLFYSQLYDQLNNVDSIDNFKVFRIYRDVRFSKDKTPYKTHFSGSFHRTKPELRGGYYLHLEPGASFIGAGFWGPNKDDLFRIRKEIEMDHEHFAKITDEPELFAKWGAMQGEQLKTAPKGFEKDHPGIKHLRFKQFIFIQNIPDSFLKKADFSEWMTSQFNSIRPFLNYMGDVLSTDLNGESKL